MRRAKWRYPLVDMHINDRMIFHSRSAYSHGRKNILKVSVRNIARPRNMSPLKQLKPSKFLSSAVLVLVPQPASEFTSSTGKHMVQIDSGVHCDQNFFFFSFFDWKINKESTYASVKLNSQPLLLFTVYLFIFSWNKLTSFLRRQKNGKQMLFCLLCWCFFSEKILV